MPKTLPTRGDGEMVDTGDLKSPDREVVRVRVPLAPSGFSSQLISHFARLSSPENTSQESLFLPIFSKVSWPPKTPVGQETVISPDLQATFLVFLRRLLPLLLPFALPLLASQVKLTNG